MGRLILRRVLLSVPLLFVASTVTFLLEALIPGDVARTIVGSRASQEQYLSLRHALGLDQPLYTQYWHWVEHAVHGNLGLSLFSQQSVTTLLTNRLGVTLWLVLGATLVCAVVGVSLGIAGALRAGPVDAAVGGGVMLGIAIPDFFLGLMLVTFFAVRLRVFPAIGYVPIEQSISGWLQSLALPVITLAAGATAVVAKQTREAMREVLERPFIRTLRAAGMPRRSIIFKHALRNAAIPVVTVLGLVFVGILSSTVVVESVFALPGLGSVAVQATVQHDLPLIQGAVIYFTVIVIVVNLIVDLAYGWLDPRVRVS